jgi:hypothetical protein
MADNILDFESSKQNHLIKRKEAKVEALRQAFRQARGEDGSASAKGRKKRGKSRKK